MIEKLLEKQRLENKKGGNFAYEAAEEEKKKKKEENKRERMRKDTERKLKESKDSYLKLHQFDFLYEKINRIKRWVKGQQDVIETMESRMIKLIEKRKNKEKVWATQNQIKVFNQLNHDNDNSHTLI